MHGNVGEWCSDFHSDALSGGTDPVDPEWDVNGVLRGGGWWNDSGVCPSADRNGTVPSIRAAT